MRIPRLRHPKRCAWLAGVTLLGVAAIPVFSVDAAASRPLYKDPSQPVAVRVQDLLSRMTLEEKVAQMQALWENKGKVQNAKGDFSAKDAEANFPDGLGQIARPSDRRGVETPQDVPGAAGATAGVVNRTARETADYINAAQHWAVEDTRLGIPLLFHEEALHGYVARGATSFPQSIGLASTWDPALIEQVFAVAAREMRARGADLALAPVVDIARDPRWGRTEETYGEDPYLVGAMGLAAVRGFQGTSLPLAPDKVFVTLKHLAGHGQPENGTNVGPAQLGQRELRTDFLYPFRHIIENVPVQSVMASYNEIDGVPSHVNKWLLDEVLRKEWGFSGAVISDYYALTELRTRHHMVTTPEEAAMLALAAGVDVETPDGEAYLTLPELVRKGRVPMSEIDKAVSRVLKMKFEAGLFEHPYVDAAKAQKLTDTPDAIALARKAAQQAMVLLKNDQGVLPLDAGNIKRLAVIGTHARDTPIGGYSDEPEHVVSVLEGLQEAGKGHFEVDYAEGVRLTQERIWAQDEVHPVDAATNDALRAAAIETAKQADTIVLVLGGNEQTSREAWADNHLGDRESLQLFGPQNELAEAIFALHKPTVVILLNGRPLAVNQLAKDAPALIEGWYLGQETGHAVADVLFGKVSPGGKLPITIPRSVGQLPVYYNRKPTARRGYLFGDASPLYPFGYGLSYTTFEVSAPRPAQAHIGPGNDLEVAVDVSNTGKVRGDEVVQLYLRDEASSVTRPLLELRRFERVTLDPGETRTVHFTLKPDDLALWDIDMRRVVEPGGFTLYAGDNSVDLKSAHFDVDADSPLVIGN